MKVSRARLLIYPLFLVMLIGCNSEEPNDIGNGYERLSTNRYNNHIVKDKTVVVYTNVVSFKRVGDFIIGNREPSVNPDVSGKLLASSEYGVFVLNMLTGELIDGLTEQKAKNIVEDQNQ